MGAVVVTKPWHYNPTDLNCTEWCNGFLCSNVRAYYAFTNEEREDVNQEYDYEYLHQCQPITQTIEKQCDSKTDWLSHLKEWNKKFTKYVRMCITFVTFQKMLIYACIHV